MFDTFQVVEKKNKKKSAKKRKKISKVLVGCGSLLGLKITKY